MRLAMRVGDSHDMSRLAEYVWTQVVLVFSVV
jgi:hypothetical protein